jgi:signal transduction histidine kinase
MIAMRTVVQETGFPLTKNVLELMADLTSAQWFTVDSDGSLLNSSLDFAEDESLRQAYQKSLLSLTRSNPKQEVLHQISIGSVDYQGIRFGLSRNRDQPIDVVVLIDDQQRQTAMYRAVALPLITGGSTIVLLTAITLWLMERVLKRIAYLEHEVQEIAAGNFDRSIASDAEDELGQLARSIDRMACQLSQMWQALRINHGHQFLYQVSGGLAHNLRNTLTGARLAVELVQKQIRSDTSQGNDSTDVDWQSLKIAVDQLRLAEDYVQRLLLVSRGREEEPKPDSVRICLESLRPSMESIAMHRGIELDWRYSQTVEDQRVEDGPTLVAAVSNLIWNAMEAGTNVLLIASIDPIEAQCLIEVIDNGPGPCTEVAASLFDPFVTSKPEGLGLGLPLVRRAAESLRGTIQWQHKEGRTVFGFQFPVL